MKDWDYYRTVNEKYYSWHEVRRQMLRELDEQKLTVAERTAAEVSLSIRATEETNRLNKPYMEEKGRLEDEFWRDARRGARI